MLASLDLQYSEALLNLSGIDTALPSWIQNPKRINQVEIMFET